MEKLIPLVQIVLTILLFPAGWLSAHYLNVAQTKRSKRLEYRLVMLHSFLDVWFFIEKHSTPFTDPMFLPLLQEARSNFLLYGTEDEQKSLRVSLHPLRKKMLIRQTRFLNS